MKPLILSFFAVLLGYSLFFDKEEKPMLHKQPEQMQSIQTKAQENMQKVDSIELYANKHLGTF